MYQFLKTVHITLAVLSVAGFALRGAWMLLDSRRLQAPIVRVAPHIVDTLLLLSGVSLVITSHLALSRADWLWIKLVALVFYILLGTVALKRGRSRDRRIVAFAFALLVFAYIAGVALSKSARSWLSIIL